jgi:hypothetical protein
MVHKVYTDNEGNELTAYINAKHLLYLSIESGMGPNYVVLDQEDLEDIAEYFQELVEDMRLFKSQEDGGLD